MIAEKKPSIPSLRSDLCDDDILEICDELGIGDDNDLLPGFDFKMSYPTQSAFKLYQDGEFPDSGFRKRARSQGNGLGSSFHDQNDFDYLDLCFPASNIEDIGILPDFGLLKGENNNSFRYSFEEKFPSSSVSSRKSSKEKLEVIHQPKEELNLSDVFRNENQDSALIFVTRFLKQYWRNDRKNLQCFPYCAEFGDYYIVKTKNLKHVKSGGTCGEAVKLIYCSQNLDENLCVALGRITREDLALDETKTFISKTEYFDLKQAGLFGSISCKNPGSYEVIFAKNVWKMDMQLSKARRSSTGPPKESSYFFEALILRKCSNGFAIEARASSEKFQISSTRTLHRATLAEKASGSQSAPRSPPVVPAEMEFDFREVSVTERPSMVKKRRIERPLMNNQRRSSSFSPPNVAEVVEEPQAHRSLTQDVQTAAAAAVAEPSNPRIVDLESQEPVAIAHAQSSTTGSRVAQPVVAPEQHILAINGNAGINETEARLWAVFLGIFGAHYFYLNRPWKGLLYALTLGCFLFGFIIDVITMSYLVSRQKVSNAATWLELPYLERAHVFEAYVYAIPLGIFGAHRFYLGQQATGFLYLCTFGLLGLGWINDLLNMEELVVLENKKRENDFVARYDESQLQTLKDLNEKYKPRSCC